MIDPFPRASIGFPKRVQVKNTLRMLVSITVSYSSGVNSSAGLMVVVPWQTTRVSRGPRSVSTVSTRRSRAAMSLTSTA